MEMLKDQQKAANRNVRVFSITKIFTKRVFFPIIAIYFMAVAGFTLRDIGILEGFYFAISLLADVPTGYLADKFKRVTTIRLGAIFLATAVSLYIIFPTRIGIFGGAIIEALGYSLISGAAEALVHDSLIILGKVDKYTKTLSQAQSFSLVVNAVLVAIATMTYSINKKLPLLIGVVCYLTFFAFSLYLREMPRPNLSKTRIFLGIKKVFRSKGLVVWGFTFGLMGALYWAPTDFLNILMKDLGFHPELLGWVYAGSSLAGAVIGFGFHHLKRLSAFWYTVLDGLIMALPLLAAITGSLPLVIFTAALNLAFWRFRRIIYQDYVLTKYEPNYKATVISALNNMEQLNLIWLPIAIGLLSVRLGLASGLFILGLISIPLIPIFSFQTKKIFD